MAVEGIGGLFFRSKNPDARAEWYRRHLRIAAGHRELWQQAAGITVFAPFAEDSEEFAAEQPFMLNLRVSGLSELIERLEAADIEIERRPEWEGTEYGSFARLRDPEGLPIELWEPPAEG